MKRSMWRAGAAALCLAVALVGCASEETSNGTAGTSSGTTAGSTAGTTTGATVRPLRILVTNDDGVDAPGIDAVVQALVALPDTEVVVVAPAANQSGTGGSTTDGPLTVTQTTTAGGYPATSVDGFPADSVIWAIDQGGIDWRPDLVVSGINAGQNLGPTVDISGTVGAARAAGSRGIPALAASQGVGEPTDFPSGVELVAAWVQEHRAELLSLAPGAGPVEIANLNIPSCGTTGEVRGVVEVPTATDVAGRNLLVVDCASTATDPTDDIGAFITGYAPLAELESTT